MFNKIFKFLSLANNPSNHKSDFATDILDSNLLIVSNTDKLQSWLCKNYLKNYESLTELKYKCICLGLFLSTKNIYLSAMPLVDNLINHISQQLIDNKETKYPVKDIFPIKLSREAYDKQFTEAFIKLTQLQNTKHAVNLNHVQLFPEEKKTSTNDLIMEDAGNNDKFNIFLKTYAIFANCGLVAQSFNKSQDSNILLELQNFKLSEKDMEVLYKKYGKITIYERPLEINIENWNKIIEKEDSLERLGKLEIILVHSSLCNHFFDHLTNDIMLKHSTIRKSISQKIEYLKLGEDLNEIPNEGIKNKKLKV